MCGALAVTKREKRGVDRRGEEESVGGRREGGGKKEKGGRREEEGEIR